jgi:quercetin dioxygenase-like cupin family protein
LEDAVIVIEETEIRTTATAAGVMAGLAAPSQGSRELSSWRVRMMENAEGPVHTIDREQVFMPVAGTFAIAMDGTTAVVAAGQAVVLPAGVVRQIRAGDAPAEALVCMPAGGTASLPGAPERHPLPWAE